MHQRPYAFRSTPTAKKASRGELREIDLGSQPARGMSVDYGPRNLSNSRRHVRVGSTGRAVKGLGEQ